MTCRDVFWKLDPSYTYLDNAASTPPLASVMDSVQDFMATYGSIHRGAGLFSEISTSRYEQARKYIAASINAKDGRDVVIFTGNSTDGINRFALLYPWQETDCVLVSDIEHSSNLLPWMKVCQVKTFATSDNFEITPDSIERELKRNKNIRIVAVSGASNVTGLVTPVKDIYQVCQKHNVFLFIDASQLAPHYPVSLDDCDFIVFSGHKMYAPFGIGVLAGRKHVLEHMGLAPSGGGNIEYISPDGSIFPKPTPYKHEAGTPNGVGAVALSAALKTLKEEIGWDRIAEHNQENIKWIKKHLTDIPGVRIYFPNPAVNTTTLTPICVFDVEHPQKLLSVLSEMRIGVRYGSFCLYRLIERLKNLPPVDNPENGLPSEYKLFRASGGLMTEEKDWELLALALRKGAC